MGEIPPQQKTPGGRTPKIRRVIFLGIYLAGLVLFLEIAGRVTWLCLDKTWGLLVPQEISRFDDMLGWSLVPGARAVSKSTGQPIEYAINSAGFRDREYPLEKPEGTFRILLLGDSHTFGFGVPLEKHFSKLLEGYFRNVEVLNMGVNGYGLDQELLLLRDKGLAYHPDVIVVYVPHYMDNRHVRDKVWGMGKPRFLLEDGRLVPTNRPVTNNSFVYRLLLDGDRFLSKWSKAYLLLRDAVIHFFVQEDRIKAETLPDNLARTIDPHAAPDAAGEKPHDPAEPDALQLEVNRLGEAIVSAMSEEAKAHGATFVLVTRLGELAVSSIKNAIPTLYLHDPLQNPGLILAGDPTRHPNEPASGILAWEISKFLNENRMIPETHLPRGGGPK